MLLRDMIDHRRSANRLVGLLIGVCACASQQRPALQTHAIPGPGVAAASYETAIPNGSALSDDDAQTLQQTLASAEKVRGVKLTGDPRLMRLASWVGTQAAASGDLPAYAVLDQAARYLGLVEPTPHILMFGGNDQREVAAELGAKLAESLSRETYTHYGGVAIQRDGLWVYVVVLAFRFLELAPVPRAVPAATSVTLTGKLTQRFASPVLVTTQPGGQVVRGKPGRGEAFNYQVALGRGVYRLEVLGEGPTGIEPVANFPLYAGEAPPASIEVLAGDAEGPVRDMNQAAQLLLQMANRERAQAGLAPLAFDRQLAAVAAGHVADMLEHHFLGHTSPTTGSPSQRVERAGIRTSLVLENIGRGSSLHEVHAGLMESPGHRGSLLHPLATHVGIAVARTEEAGRTDYLATELFIRVTPELSGDAAEKLLGQVNVRRVRASRSELQDDAALRGVAVRAAQRCFAPGASDQTMTQGVQAELRGSPQLRGTIGVLIVMGSSVDELAQVDALLEPGVKKIGIGLTQGQRAGMLPNTLCGVFLLGQ